MRVVRERYSTLCRSLEDIGAIRRWSQINALGDSNPIHVTPNICSHSAPPVHVQIRRSQFRAKMTQTGTKKYHVETLSPRGEPTIMTALDQEGLCDRLKPH